MIVLLSCNRELLNTSLSGICRMVNFLCLLSGCLCFNPAGICPTREKLQPSRCGSKGSYGKVIYRNNPTGQLCRRLEQRIEKKKFKSQNKVAESICQYVSGFEFCMFSCSQHRDHGAEHTNGTVKNLSLH